MSAYLAYLLAIAIGVLRPLGIFLVLPVFNASNLGSATVRTALCLVLAMPVIPQLAAADALHSPTMVGLIMICIREMLLGIIFGAIASIPFWAIDGAGYLIDTIGGSEMSSLFNPALGTQSSLLGTFFSKALTLLFFTSGGWRFLFNALYESYRDLPVGSTFTLSARALDMVLPLLGMVLQLAVRFALPAILVMLVIDLSFGLLNRAVHQMDVFFLAMPIKSVASALMISVALAFAFQPYIDQLTRLGTVLRQISLVMR
ncbi:type III secretion system export apparatus subunit SctT [Paraburkholderia sediminicola]|uniref:type III secretion system export apparatus subunit SctT n=1 Tax=Paraburkholderia sediminicola TaxID=458836 RepID=UPI0038B94444